MSTVSRLKFIHQQLQQCRACPRVCGTPVHGVAIETPIMLVGQAPGTHEARLGRPFAYTAGKTLFKWLGGALNMDEEEIRERVYFAAVARCFPGKSPKGSGDREPDAGEVENCRRHLREEVAALRPRVVLAVGRVAMAEVLGPKIFPKGTKLAEVVGRKFKVRFHDHEVEVIPLPHPSGLSTWPHTEPGKTKLRRALAIVRKDVAKHLE